MSSPSEQLANFKIIMATSADLATDAGVEDTITKLPSTLDLKPDLVSKKSSSFSDKLLLLPRLSIPIKSIFVACDDFKSFPKLPREVRNQIWEYAAMEPRRILLYAVHNSLSEEEVYKDQHAKLNDTLLAAISTQAETFGGQTKHPGMLQTSKEGRVEGLRYYTLCQEKARWSRKYQRDIANIVYVNTEIDILFIPKEHEWQYTYGYEAADYNFQIPAGVNNLVSTKHLMLDFNSYNRAANEEEWYTLIDAIIDYIVEVPFAKDPKRVYTVQLRHPWVHNTFESLDMELFREELEEQFLEVYNHEYSGYGHPRRGDPPLLDIVWKYDGVDFGVECLDHHWNSWNYEDSAFACGCRDQFHNLVQETRGIPRDYEWADRWAHFDALRVQLRNQTTPLCDSGKVLENLIQEIGEPAPID